MNIKIKNDVFSRACPLCGSNHIKSIGNISYLTPVMFSTHVIDLQYKPELWECENCQSWFTNNIIDDKTTYELYREGSSDKKWNNKDKFEDSKHEDIIKTLKSLFFPGCKVLDIGCNTGELLDFAKEQECITYGVEFSKTSRSIIETKGHHSFAKLEDIKDITFDLIFGFDLIEHLHDVNAFLKKNLMLLSQSGKLIFLSGNKDSLSAKLSKNKWWYLKYPEHIVFPSKKYFIKNTDFQLENSIETYASKGYETSLRNLFILCIKSMLKGKYSGLPSIGPDHHLLVLKKTNNCTVCNSKKNSNIYQLYDDRYGYSGNFNLLKCFDCGHMFLEHTFSSSDLGNLYSNYYPRSSMKTEDYSPLKYEQGFKSWFNGENRSAYTYVPKNVKVLDIGCGFGQSLGYHKSRGCDVYGVEADENIQRVADKFGFRVKVGLFDANDYEKDFFDYVTMDQVIEHMSDPIQVLSDVFSVLKPGAYAIVSTPNATGWGAKLFGKRWINWHTPYHLQHFSKKSLTLTATKAGFTIVSLRTVTSSEWLYYQWIHLVTFPKPGEKSVFWNPCSTTLSLKQKIILKILHILHKIKCNHFLTRFFDAIGIGDNYILVLKKPQ